MVEKSDVIPLKEQNGLIRGRENIWCGIPDSLGKMKLK